MSQQETTTILKNREVLLHLALIDDVGPAAALKLIRMLCSPEQRERVRSFDDVPWAQIDLTQLYDYAANDLMVKAGATSLQAQRIASGLADHTRLDVEYALIEKYGVKIYSIDAPAYPLLLRSITNPPLVLWGKGALLAPDALRMAVVGSRAASGYAQRVINLLVPDLVSNGWQIISGGALGADTMAHRATLDAGGSTVAVLGSGLCYTYPSENKGLFDRIAAHNGAVLSPFYMHMAPSKINFPARNRVISGLSQGCLVIQAAAKSGALISAHCALEQGRDVFAVPGLIDDPLSAGCHRLIGQGAKLVQDSNDILYEYGMGHVVVQQAVIPFAQPIAVKKDVLPALEESDDILRCFGQERSVSLDHICQASGLDVVAVQGRLFDLQLDGKIKQNFAGGWERV